MVSEPSATCSSTAFSFSLRFSSARSRWELMHVTIAANSEGTGGGSARQRRPDLLQEAEHAPPRVLACLCVLAERAVEERVRRTRVGDDLVLDAGLLQPALVG